MKLFAALRERTIAACVALLALGGAIAYAQGYVGVFQNGAGNGPSVYGTGDPTSGLYFGTGRVGIAKHLETGVPASGNVPAPTSCGTSPSLASGSTDTAGTITMGTTATGCVLTFGTAFVQSPICTVTWRATPLASQSYTTANTGLTLTQTSTSNNVVDYVCVARSGG